MASAPRSGDLGYDAGTMVLHWAIATAVTAQFALGWWMVGLPDEGGSQARWFNLHKSIGLTLAALVLARLGWRALRGAPPLPPGLPAWQRRTARVTHGGLDACLLVLGTTGYLGSSFSGYPVRYFGYALPAWGWKWPEAKEFLGAVHLGATWVLALLVLLHLAGVLWHLVRREPLFQRMVPRRKKP